MILSECKICLICCWKYQNNYSPDKYLSVTEIFASRQHEVNLPTSHQDILWKNKGFKVNKGIYNSLIVISNETHFRDVLHNGLGMTDSYMMERVMVALDRGTSPYVTMATFAKAMSLYLRGDLEERITYAFTCYDLLGEGYLRRETMYQCMKKSLAKASRDDDVEEAVKEFVDIMLKRMDRDLDGVINFKDFHESVVHTPSLLESLGYCLPERPAVFCFIATWSPSWGRM